MRRVLRYTISRRCYLYNQRSLILSLFKHMGNELWAWVMFTWTTPDPISKHGWSHSTGEITLAQFFRKFTKLHR